MQSFISRPNTSLTAILLMSFILLAGCGQSDDQREFEREAFAAPDNYTETTDDRQIISEDPDDWRVSPFYQGLIDVDPAYPNPVLTTDQVSIDMLAYDDVVSNIEVISYFAEDNIPITVIPKSDNVRIDLGTTISMQPSQMSRTNLTDDIKGLKRIIILDNDGNVISYGDIMVE